VQSYVKKLPLPLAAKESFERTSFFLIKNDVISKLYSAAEGSGIGILI